ncbi:hypothetical protein ALO94_200349 [Pseudomonas syringae pv. spinaceae]|uniref:Uncharacterized protein n=1 Tax=Pseudomonas syringae pv. spinaceae TaxID=264459 RepID=A0A0Q0B3N2_PSESX|nr:hypothetical protein ALO94_200349 [Pseudomonas syringae pv. spinaceae]
MRVGAQENLALLLGGLQRCQQVRCKDAGFGNLSVELLIQVGVQAGRLVVTDVLRVQTGFCRNDGQNQFAALFFQGVAHALNQRQVVGFVLLAIGNRIELFIGVQPLVLAEHHARPTFVEQFEVQRRPQVGAQAFDRKLIVVMGFRSLGPFTVEHGGLGRGREVAETAQRPGSEDQQNAQEDGDVEDS